jgi:enamine deaminase RidA (YjgF/YER057c/UK114 family)
MAGIIDPEDALARLGIVLPSAPPPVANFAPTARSGDLVFVSGQGPVQDGEPVFRGKVGGELTEEAAYQAARLCAINSLAVLSEELGGLGRVRRIVKLLGFVASAATFTRQPYVINGASDLLAEVFAGSGGHARSAIGTNVLPFDIPVEIEVIAEVSG